MKNDLNFDENLATIELLKADILFVMYRDYSIPCGGFTHNGKTISLSVNLGDCFAYAYADAEDISDEKELQDLYNWVQKYPIYGFLIWASLKRKTLPIEPRIKHMKELNSWPEELKNLENQLDLKDKSDKF